MALGDAYATLSELKNRLGIDVTDTADDNALTDALNSASRGVDAFCSRQFNQAAGASARVYRPLHGRLAFVDDLHTTTGLVVATDADGDGTFETVLTAADYELEPLNGIVDAEEGWPFWRISAIGDLAFPMLRRASVQVTAQWGWTAVPANVKEATLVAAPELFKLKDAPFGVAGFGEFGPLRVRDNPKVASMLAKYRRKAVRVGS